MIFLVIYFAFLAKGARVMNVSELNPYIRAAMHSVLRAPFTINRRVILDYELILIESGELLLRCGDGEGLYHAGDVLLLRPGIPHSFHCTGTSVSQPHIHFDLRYERSSPAAFISFKDIPAMSGYERGLIRRDELAGAPESPLLRVSDMQRFRELFFAVIDCPEGMGSVKAKAAMLLLIELIFNENFPSVFETAEPHDVVSVIKDFLDANPAADIDLGTLERQFCYSRFHIEKRFRARYGTSVMKYRGRRRMDFARELLADHSVSEAGALAGFSSVYVFSRAFKQYFGCSPSSLRKG